MKNNEEWRRHFIKCSLLEKSKYCTQYKIFVPSMIQLLSYTIHPGSIRFAAKV